jgi:transporter family protein
LTGHHGEFPRDADLKTESLWLYYAIGSALFGGATAILAKVGVSGIDSNVATFLRTLVVLVFAGVIVSVRADWTGIGTASVRTLTFLALSGLATGASWLCYFRALQLAPASRVAPIDKLSVVVAVVLGVLLLGETLSLKLVIGAALIVAGTILIAI